jgi:hypothetical protein
MDQPARYCEYCGKPLNEKARFCGRCGKPVDLGEGEQVSPPVQPAPHPVQKAQPSRQAASLPPRPAQPPAQRAALVQRPVQAPPPRPAPAEVVCGVIPGAFQRKGVLGLGQQAFTLVLTNYRVIFAMQTNQMLQEQVRQARAEAKGEGKGFFGQWGAQLSASTKYYQHKPPEAILAEQPGNFFIPHNALRSVKFHMVHGGENSPDEYRLEFDAVSGKVSVIFTMLDQKKAQQALTQVLGEKVHWSHGFFG